jgi:C4-dicarboxylate transporter DctQ subunit
MKSKGFTKRFFDNFESYICQFLLSFFVILLFIQIVLRQTFGYTISWGEELARFAFVWFVYFGASYAARLGAHNRVTIQLRLLPGNAEKYIEALADCIWILFNVVMIYKSTMLIASMMKYTYISPTLGWSMAYVYMIFPLSFTAITIRVIQVNYLRLIKKVEMRDPDRIESDEDLKMADEAEAKPENL